MTADTVLLPTRRAAQGVPTRDGRWPAVGEGDRPRVLSYIGRWGRARRWLPADAQRVIDVGCAFGYGTVAVAHRGNPPRWIAGLERDAENVDEAARAYPWLPMVRGDATALPFGDGTLDAILFLDVVEHFADPTAVLAEARRVLRPGGYLVVTVPHRGPLARFDSNNAYAALRVRRPSFLPLEPCEESATGTHRHFTLSEMQRLLGPAFVVDRFARSGLGLAELLHLLLLVVFKGALRWRGAYLALRPLYHMASLLEDLIPAGPAGYNLAVRARPVAPSGEAEEVRS